MKKLKISIIVLIILISIISIILLVTLKSTRKVDNNISINSESSNIIDNSVEGLTDEQKSEFEIKEGDNISNINTQLKSVTGEEEYFIVKDIIEEYYFYCKQLTAKPSDYIRGTVSVSNEELERYAKEARETAQLAIYNILDKSYLNEFNITEEDISEKFKRNNSSKIVLDKMYVVNNSDKVSFYIISGILVDVNNEKISKFNTGIFVDMQNFTFLIYPQEYLEKHGYDKMKLGEQVKVEIESIEKNQYNTFTNDGIEESEIFEEYFENYKYNMIYNNNDAYNKLDENYAKLRFGSKEKFEENLKLRENTIRSEIISKFTTVSKVGYTEYICITNYGNKITFKRNNGILDYTVILDDYTIMSSTDIAKYSKMDNLQKATYQLNNFIKKVNTKDYETIYNNLDSTFKNNNFKNVDELKKYIENNFYNLNTINIEEYDGETYEYCIFQCKLTNVEDSEKIKKLNAVIFIKEGTDFTMSFSVQ